MSAASRPALICRECWNAWATGRPPLLIGYCPHARIAWRITRRGEVRTLEMEPREYRPLLRAVEALEGQTL